MIAIHVPASDVPDISIIIVNKDRHELTLECIQSIYDAQVNHTYEIILVDSSWDDLCTREAVHRFPSVRVCRTSSKQGFAQNYNQGMNLARGRIWFNLNNDTLVQPGAVDALIDAIDCDSNLGMAGPVLRGINGEIQPPCARELLTLGRYLFNILLLDPGFVFGKWWNSRLSRKLEQRQSGPVSCISGAAMAVPADVALKFGMFDEGYKFYFEDIEWCYRIQKHGLQVAYIAEAVITHFGDQTASGHRYWAKISEYQGALRYFSEIHRLKKPGLYLLWMATVLAFLERIIIFGVKKFLGVRDGYYMVYTQLLAWIVKNPPGKEHAEASE